MLLACSATPSRAQTAPPATLPGGPTCIRPLFIERIRTHLNGHALGADVACGTGLGSVALAELLEEVLAFDVSAAMLNHAAMHPRVTYAQAPAEALPIPDASLDVLTVAQGIHWFDRPRFYAEARRTLKPGGVLAVYDLFFRGALEHHPDFHVWMATAYMTRYPPRSAGLTRSTRPRPRRRASASMRNTFLTSRPSAAPNW